MSIYLKLWVLFCFNYIIIECILPGVPKLSVVKLDQKLIDKKRQDTLDMCRMFNEEKDKDLSNTEHKLNNANNRKQNYERNTKNKNGRRVKREVDPGFDVNPLLNAEDVRRVESIIDKIYDDMNENGEKVKYRRFNQTLETPEMDPNIKQNVTNAAAGSGRRFNFAPASISVKETTERTIDNGTVPGRLVRFKRGIVPYFIDPKTYDTHLIESITEAFQHLEKLSCIRLQRLRERPTDLKSLHKITWIFITNPSGIRQCVHSNDRAKIKGVQMIVFGYDCMTRGDILHEMMHVLGFPHEHVRPDRDQYITIMWDNIKPGYKKYFEADENSEMTIFPYDYKSILHYPPRAFSRNGQVTIWIEPGTKIGQREGLSEIDLQKIDTWYSAECQLLNKEYLITTCPSVVKSKPSTKEITEDEIKKYFQERIWPYAIVNYKISGDTEFSSEELDNIQAVFRHIEDETCIEFRNLAEKDPNENDEDNDATIEVHKNSEDNATVFDAEDQAKTYNKSEIDNVIKTEPDNGTEPQASTAPPTPKRRHMTNVLVLKKSDKPGCICPPPGMPTGQETLTINVDCFNSVNDLLHVFVHILGLDHQHNMHDRDDFLYIQWDSITDEFKEELREKLPPAASAGFPYDYQSVMHYPWLQIRNGRSDLMYPIWNDGWAMGHWEGLSATDVQKLNLIYFEQCIDRKQFVKKQKTE